MRRHCTDVRQAGGANKKGLFAELYQLVNMHELGDLAVVHPAARGNTANGNRTAVACMTEGADIARALAELHALGVDTSPSTASWRWCTKPSTTTPHTKSGTSFRYCVATYRSNACT